MSPDAAQERGRLRRPSFDWTVDESRSWPPRGRPREPFSPTSIEVLRSCPLRAYFEASPGYERRTSYSARIGIAFHAALQSLTEDPLQADSRATAIAEVRGRFDRNLEKQDEIARARPRETVLGRDQARVERAATALSVEAARLFDLGLTRYPVNGDAPPDRVEETDAPPTGGVEHEIAVRSSDGMFHGRVDRAEHWPIGTCLVDYKAAVRDDLAERYERQVQLYASMWRDTRGVWPVDARVVYPLTGAVHAVSVTPETCERVLAESAALVAEVRSLPIEYLGRPGDVCRVCDFRPWCRTFWNSQRNEPNDAVALERAALGFEGTVTSVDVDDRRLAVDIAWRQRPVRIVAPAGRFPQIERVTVGAHVRALDLPLSGQRSQPRGTGTPFSEIFVVDSPGRSIRP